MSFRQRNTNGSVICSYTRGKGSHLRFWTAWVPNFITGIYLKSLERGIRKEQNSRGWFSRSIIQGVIIQGLWFSWMALKENGEEFCDFRMESKMKWSMAVAVTYVVLKRRSKNSRWPSEKAWEPIAKMSFSTLFRSEGTAEGVTDSYAIVLLTVGTRCFWQET